MAIVTYAGTGISGSSGDNGLAALAQLGSPDGVASDSNGNIYIADGFNNKIRMVSSTGIISTIAGTGISGSSGDAGLATLAQLNSPYGIVVDISGKIYISDSGNSKIRVISTSGIISTFANVNSPAGITVTSAGTLFIACSTSNQIQTVSSVGVITNILSAYFPSGVALGLSGSLYFAETLNCRIRMVDSSGIITTIAGGTGIGYSGDGGQATLASLAYPTGVAVNSVGTLYIADTNNYVIRMVSTAGIITTFAGTGGVSGSTGDGGAPTSCLFSGPGALAVDSSDRVYVTDGNKVRVIGNVYVCSAGNYVSSTTSGTCAACPTGSYSASTSPATSCTSCLASTYMSSTGATACTPCPTGTMSFVLGATDVTSCSTVR